MRNSHFSKLYFGEASAEYEIARDRSRFLSSYLDHWGIARKFRENEFFLILGPKGVGKTSVGYFVENLLHDEVGESQTFCRRKMLDELSPNISALSALTSKLVSEESAGVTTDAWKLFIALQYARMAHEDHGSELADSPQFLDLMRDLQDAGLVEADFPTVLRKVRERSLKFNLKAIAHDSSVGSSDLVSIQNLGEALLNLIFSAETNSSYLLIVDGLDRITGAAPAYWLSIASLLQAASAIHIRTMAMKSRIRLLVMCRSDVFRRVKFADADKIAGDASIFIDWANQQTRKRDSPLWDYLAQKAGISVDDLLRHFDQRVTVGERRGKARFIDGIDYMIESTRSTPREMTMLMKQLQDVVPPNGSVTGERMRAAVDNFASRDLLSIVQAESAHVLSEELHVKYAEILSELPSASEVQLDDLRMACTELGLERSAAAELSEFLFMAGLLGNLHIGSGYVQFYYRRDTYAFNRKGPWRLHKGLMYAYNIPY